MPKNKPDENLIGIELDTLHKCEICGRGYKKEPGKFCCDPSCNAHQHNMANSAFYGPSFDLLHRSSIYNQNLSINNLHSLSRTASLFRQDLKTIYGNLTTKLIFTKNLIRKRLEISSTVRIISPNSKYMITNYSFGSSDYEDLLIYEIKQEGDFQLQEIFKKRLKPITALAISSDSKHFVSGHSNGVVDLWDIENKTCKIINHEKHSEPIYSLAIDLQKRFIVGGFANEVIKLWDFNTGSLLCTLKHESHGNFTYPLEEIKLLAKTDHLYMLTRSSTSVNIWHILRFNFQITQKHILPQVNCGGLHNIGLIKSEPDNNENDKIVVGTCGGTAIQGRGNIFIWDVETGEALHTITASPSGLNCICVSPSGKYIVSISSADRSIKIWCTTTGRCLRRYIQENLACSVAISPSEKYFVVAGHGFIKIRDFISGDLLYISHSRGFNNDVLIADNDMFFTTDSFVFA